MEQQLVQVIDKLAAKLGVAVDVLWAALMRQAPLYGLVDLLWIAVYALGVYWTVRYAKLVYQKTQERGGWDEVAWLPCGIIVALMFGIGIATIAGLNMTLAAFFNPEYWALMKILK